MSFSQNISGREYDKFVESPTRPGRTAIETVATFSQKIYSSPNIKNISIISGVETEIFFSLNTMKFLIRARPHCTLKVAFSSGETTNKYLTIYPGSNWNEENISLDSSRVFVLSDKNCIIELVEWF